MLDDTKKHAKEMARTRDEDTRALPKASKKPKKFVDIDNEVKLVSSQARSSPRPHEGTAVAESALTAAKAANASIR